MQFGGGNYKAYFVELSNGTNASSVCGRKIPKYFFMNDDFIYIVEGL